MRKVIVAAAILAVGQLGCPARGPRSQPEISRHPTPRDYPTVRTPPLQKPPPPAANSQNNKASQTRRSGSWYPKGRELSSRWKTIVIHHSATRRGGAELFGRDHIKRNGWDELGYHFVIGNGTSTPDGMVEVGPRWNKQKHGAHCKTANNYYNEHGIGICLVGDFTKSRPTPRQLNSLRRLVQFLVHACGIAPGRITTHRAVTGKTQCPGPNFSLPALRKSIAPRATATNLPRAG